MASITNLPVLVVGGSGYVAGELLRLLVGHPGVGEVTVTSQSQAGEALGDVFPHLQGAYPALVFQPLEAARRWLEGHARAGVLSAAPHGASAALLDGLLADAEEGGRELLLVDVSADFRFRDSARYQAVYGHPHGAPERLGRFVCAVPEHAPEVTRGPIAHPGCFTTSVVLAARPLLLAGALAPRLSVTAITGSTGAGRTPTATTHHPARRSAVFAYQALGHRHAPEMRSLLVDGRGVEPEVFFVPQAGPHARGIYTVIHAEATARTSAAELAEVLSGAYAGSPFVKVRSAAPRLPDVVGGNQCHLSVAVEGRHVVVISALDNLVKGAAGGAVQWLDRLAGWPETWGLDRPGLGWF
jgi:N-acetyl-gamma-glutamyl-phosphate reductase